ncbi:hypothetical protein ACDP63_23895 [Paracoccus sp. P2]|uniref:Uncharacterized protein n=1 Tax=Paracoccus pantotrophus TaxID=82367 RepID=A0A7H9C0T8_PARPN|nr:hypothetical protein [Paracoccus pantotrophus]MDF3856621.1 hypothetical protein [Paracoccus pantotrophus]QLH16616.1 hypothetical protein HYQ43_20540 [Paracoccus pantotrophus]RDD92949.1 hypothetical protein DTW92_19975 [Paracoccus pantotrophus]WGR66223.1 hypothetical protein E3U24_12990 [Paracoccus pantotrophus]
MADALITSDTFVPVLMPGMACKMMVRDAPVEVTFTPAPVQTRGLALFPGDVLPIGAGDAIRARKTSDFAPTLVFEVLG